MEHSCNETIDVLREVLSNTDLYAVAAKGRKGDSSAQLLPMEKKLSTVCTLLREHSEILLEQLYNVSEKTLGGKTMSRCHVVTGDISSNCDSVLPAVVDTALFVRKSQLLRERMRRVNSTLGSVKHVGLLSDSSTGRRVITERAHTAVKELLDVVLTVSSTLSTPVLALSAHNGEDVAPGVTDLCREEASEGMRRGHAVICKPEDHPVANCTIFEQEDRVSVSNHCGEAPGTVKRDDGGSREGAEKCRVTVLSKSFYGSLWLKLLCEDDVPLNDIDGTCCTWRDIFTKDICQHLGISTHSVWNVCASNVAEECDSGCGRRVQFHVQLPSSVDDSTVEQHLRRCDFAGLLAQYARMKGELDLKDVVASPRGTPAQDDGNSHSEADPMYSSTREGGGWNGDRSLKCSDVNDESTLTTFPITLTNVAVHPSNLPSPNDTSSRDSVGRTVEWQHQQEGKGGCDDVESYEEEPTLFQGQLDYVRSDTAHSNVEEKLEMREIGHDTATGSCGVVVSGRESGASGHSSSPPHALSKDPLPSSLLLTSGVKGPSSGRNIQSFSHAENQSGSNSWLSQLPPQPPQRRPHGNQQDSLQLLITRHKKAFSGTHWNVVISNLEDEIIQTFASEVTSLFELSRECVKDIEFSLKGNTVAFGLVHDRYLLEDEINALIAVFDFPKVLKIYRSFVDSRGFDTIRVDVDAERGATVTHGGADKGTDVYVAPLNDSLNSETFFKTPSKNISDAQFLVDDECDGNPFDEDECSEIRGIVWRRPHEIPPPFHEDSLTPNNEPATLAHIALLHDVPLELLIALNPHVASYDADMPLPQSARLNIPRPGPLTENNSMSPSLRSVTPPSRQVKHEMNLRAVAAKLGITVHELRRSNSHLDGYGDTELLPLSCSINVPALLVASADIGSFNSSQRSTPLSVSRTGNLGTNQRFTSSDRTEGGMCHRLYNNQKPKVSEQQAESLVSKGPCSERTLAKVDSRSPSPLSHSESSRCRRAYITSRSEGGSPSIRTGPGSSTTRSIPPFVETAVRVMTRAITKFLLLRFFAKWRFYARVKRHQTCKRSDTLHMEPTSVTRVVAERQQVSTGSKKHQETVTERNYRPHVSDLRARLQELRKYSGSHAQLSATSRAAPRSVPRRGPSLVRESKMASPAAAAGEDRKGGTLGMMAPTAVACQRPKDTKPREEMGRHGSTSRRVPSTGARLRRMMSEGCVSSPERVQRSGVAKSTHRSRSQNNPLRFTSTNPNGVGIRSQSPSCDLRSKTMESLMPEWIPIGLVVSPDQLAVEIQTSEASAAGIDRGDIILEVDGKRVRTIKDVRNVLSNGLAPHVFVTVQKKNKSIAAYRVSRSDVCR